MIINYCEVTVNTIPSPIIREPIFRTPTTNVSASPSQWTFNWCLNVRSFNDIIYCLNWVNWQATHWTEFVLVLSAIERVWPKLIVHPPLPVIGRLVNIYSWNNWSVWKLLKLGLLAIKRKIGLTENRFISCYLQKLLLN